MLQCNKIKGCENRMSCEHAIKHFETKACIQHIPGCHVPRGRRCKVIGFTKRKIESLVNKTADKVKMPISKEEANVALMSLRNLVLIEKRMRGEKIKKEFNGSEMERAILGLDIENVKALFPDMSDRGLDKQHVRKALLDATKRIEKIQYTRRCKAYNPITTKSMEDLKRILTYQRERFLQKTIEENYTLKPRRNYFYDVHRQPSTDKVRLVFQFGSKRHGGNFNLALPIGKSIRKAKWHKGGDRVIILDYKDIKERAYIARVLVGEGKKFRFIESLIVDGRIATDVEKEYKKILKKEKLQLGGK